MRWARNIQDYLLVTLITALIWLYAEGRNVQTYSPASPVPVRVQLPGDDLVVMEQRPERFSMQFRGAQSELDRVRRALGSGMTLELTQMEPGEFSVVMSEHLPEADPIAGLSVNVTTVDPPMMQLKVDRLVTREIELAFTPREVQLAGDSLAIEPERVSVTIPESRLDDLGDAEQRQLQVEPSVPLRLLPAGQQQTVRGRVQLPPELADDPHVEVDPQEVQLTFTIDTRDDSVTLPSVPVWVTAPPSDLENYEIRLDEESRVLRDVQVSGPSDLVQRVRDGSLRVVATLWLSSDDLARAVDDSATATVTFPLPPALTVSAETTSVRYTVTRRDD